MPAIIQNRRRLPTVPSTILKFPLWMEPRYFVNGTGTQTVATAGQFSGTITRFTIYPGHNQVSINANTGVISVTTGADFAWKTFIVTATTTTGITTKAEIELRVFTATKTIDLGASQAYYSVTPVAGDIVVVRAGSSAETWYLNSAGWETGTASAPVELVAYPGESCVLNLSGVTTSQAIYAGDTHDLIIRGLEIIGGANCPNGIETWKSSRIKIEQCRIHNFQRFGIIMSADALNVSYDNSARYNKVWDNVKENSARGMTEGWATGIRADANNRVKISRNTSWNNYGEGLGMLACTDGIIFENVLYDNFSVNCYMDNCRGIEAVRNVVYSNDSNYYKLGAPATALMAANEPYTAGEAFLQQTSSGLRVHDNIYLSTNIQPFYDASFGLATGAGINSQFSNNYPVSTVDTRWPGMIAPTIVTRATNASSTSDSTSFTVTMPSSIVVGNMLIAVVSADGNPTLTVNTGSSGVNWKKLGQASNSTVVTGGIFWKLAEGSDALVITSSASEQFSATVLQVSNARSLQGASANGSSTNSDAPNLAPTWGVSTYTVPCLWIATRSGDSTVVATVAPSSYSNLQSQAAGGTSGASTNTAERSLTASSENPGTFTSTTEQWVSWTLAACSLPV